MYSKCKVTSLRIKNNEISSDDCHLSSRQTSYTTYRPAATDTSCFFFHVRYTDLPARCGFLRVRRWHKDHYTLCLYNDISDHHFRNQTHNEIISLSGGRCAYKKFTDVKKR